MAENSINPTPTFYNVMPEANITTKMTSSAPIPTAPASLAPVTVSTDQKIMMPAPSRFHKKYLIIPGLLIAAALIGGGVWYFGGMLTKDNEAPLVVNEDVPKDETPTNPDVTVPGDWLARYFKSETCTETNICGDKADPDRDGLSNKEEYEYGYDPNNPDGDKDGLADGDEKYIFGTDAIIARTYRDGEYNDADFVKGGYDITTNAPYTQEKLAEIIAIIKTKGLHQPTLSTIGEAALTIYTFSDPNNPVLPMPDVEQTPEAKLDRDTRRQTTIKKVGVALVKYKEATKSYPATTDFIQMSDLIGSYNTLATNYNDPININQYVYGYQPGANNKDFVLTYFSETQNQLIKYNSASAEEEASKEIKLANDEKRKTDLESLKSALMLYSNTKLDPNSEQIFSFPPANEYQASMVKYFSAGLPKDPITKLDYPYEVGAMLDTFVIKATLQSPDKGTTGYMCNQEDCKTF